MPPVFKAYGTAVIRIRRTPSGEVVYLERMPFGEASAGLADQQA
jgi:hypothetical protein